MSKTGNPFRLLFIYILIIQTAFWHIPGQAENPEEPKRDLTPFGVAEFRELVVKPLLEDPTRRTVTIKDLLTTYLTALGKFHAFPEHVSKYFGIPEDHLYPHRTFFWSGEIANAEYLQENKFEPPENASLLHRIQLFVFRYCLETIGYENWRECVDAATTDYRLPYPFWSSGEHSHVIQKKGITPGSTLEMLVRPFLCMARDMDDESVVFAGYGIPDTDKSKITSKADLYNAFKGLEGGCASDTFTPNPLTEATIAKEKSPAARKGKPLFTGDTSTEPEQEPEADAPPAAWVSSYFADGKETFIHAKAKGVLKAASGIAAFQRMVEVEKRKNNFLLRYSLKQHHAYPNKTLVSLFNNPQELVTFWEQKVRFQQTYTNEFPKPSELFRPYLQTIMEDVFRRPKPIAESHTLDIGFFLNSINAKTMTHFSKFMLETVPTGKIPPVFNDDRAQFLMGQSPGYPSVFFDMEKQELITTPLATKRLLLNPESRIVHMPPLFNAPLHQKMKALSADTFPDKDFETDKEARLPFPMGSSDVLIGPGGEGVSGEDVQNALLAYSMHFVRGIHNYCQKDKAYSEAEAKTIQCMHKKLTEEGFSGANINETAVLKIAEERGIETVDKTTGEAIPMDEIVSDVVSTTPVDESCIESVTPEMGKNNICLAYHFAMTHWDEELRDKSCDGKLGWLPWHDCAWSNFGSIAINVGLITLTTLLVVQLFSLAIKGKGWFWEGKKKKKKKAKAVPAVARPMERPTAEPVPSREQPSQAPKMIPKSQFRFQEEP